ncbi:MAG: hypothetical protein LBQ98_09940 [Nitrososphaerota archaeon]|nr:hypothetical protein [Nitrososphaerota archaeon]
MMDKKTQKTNTIQRAKVLLFTSSIVLLVILCYLSIIKVISTTIYLCSGFGIMIAITVINYALNRFYGNKLPKNTV